MRTPIQKIIEETSNVWSFRLKKMRKLVYKAGQWSMVDFEGIKIPLSISSSPSERFMQLTIKKGTATKNFFRKSSIDYFNIERSRGFLCRAINYKNIVLVAGGMGIVPFRSIIKYIIDKKLKIDTILIYFCKRENDIIFKKDLERFKKSKKINVVICLTSEKNSVTWRGLKGRVSTRIISKYCPDIKTKRFFICGPYSMVSFTQKILGKLRTPSKNILIESWV